jgi:hypothetical protein
MASFRHLIPARVLVSLLIAGGVFLFCSDAYPQDQPLLTQQERQLHSAARPNPLCKPSPYETPITYSELTVFDSREVVYQISTVVPCLGQVVDPPWGLRWDAPSGTKAVFRYRLSVAEFEQLKTFLDRADVKAIDSFLNAGPGVGDFKIAITRPSGTQNIEVLSLMPNHDQLVKNPALVHLVCRAKDMARISSKSGELPDWCRNARPLNGQVPP